MDLVGMDEIRDIAHRSGWEVMDLVGMNGILDIAHHGGKSVDHKSENVQEAGGRDTARQMVETDFDDGRIDRRGGPARGSPLMTVEVGK